MMSQLSEQKERELIEKVELRFALADTPPKFEKSLDTFLAPLLLKLASKHVSVRQAVLNSLKDILSRLNSLRDVKLPVEKLIQQAQEPPEGIHYDNNDVRLYSLLMVSKGIERLSKPGAPLIATVMKGISKLPDAAKARMFHILCKILLKWTPPEKGTKYEEDIQNELRIQNEEDARFLSLTFTRFFLLVPAKPDPQAGVIPRGYSCPGLSAREVSFFTYDAGVSFSKEQMKQFKRAIFNFVISGLSLSERDMALFLLVVSTDPSDVSEMATQQMKRISVPYEDPVFVDQLVELYSGNKKNGYPPAKHELQENILSILNRSMTATNNHLNVSIICSIGMNSQHYKLRSLCLKFIRHAARNNYQSLTPLKNQDESQGCSISIASLIRGNLNSDGWPRLQLGVSTPNFNTATIQRQSLYETLGEVLKRDESLLRDLSYIEFLFDSLKGDLAEFRPSIQECLTSLTVSIHKLPQTSKDKLRAIIRKNLADDYQLDDAENKEAKDAIMACRLVCIKYANTAFPFSDPEARMFNIWGTARTNRFDIIEESFKGLHPHWFDSIQAVNTLEYKSSKEHAAAGTKEIIFPSFRNFTQQLLRLIKENTNFSSANVWKTLGTAVRFSKQCLISEAIRGKNTMVIQDEDWSIRIENALILDEKVSVIVRGMFAHLNEDWFLNYMRFLCNEFILKDDNGHQTSHSKYTESVFGEVLLTFLRFCDEVVLISLESLIPGLFNYLKSHETLQDSDVEIAANILGIISAREDIPASVTSIISSVEDSKADLMDMPSVIANAFIFPRLLLRNSYADTLRPKSDRLLRKLESFLTFTKHKKMVYRLIAEVCKFDLLSKVDEKSRKTFISKVTVYLEKSLVNDAVSTEIWGYLSMFAHESEDFENNFKSLLGTHVSKQIDYLFSAGEALSVVAGGWNSKFLYQQLDVVNVSLTQLQENFPQERISFVLDRLLICCDSTKPSLRKASCLWMLSLIQYLGHTERVSSRCSEIHIRFMRFLGDRDEFVQESAARGLSVIYEIGNADLKEEMVKGLLRSFTDSTNAITISSGSVGTETQLFEENMLKTDEGSVRTYKDILNLAAEVGDPALVYKFMSLAKSSSLWSSKKGIAFGLGAIMSKSSLQGLLLEDKSTADKLIPKLFRYRFDPYPNVARSMNDIWQTLVLDSNATVEEYFEDILQELLGGMSNKEWRVREASTLGLLQLVQLQRHDKLENHLLQIWTMAFRAVDDIKESVREAGTKLTKVLSKILLSSIDSSKGVDANKSRPILDHILPFLLGTKGLNSDAEEVRNFALKTVIDLVKNTGDAVKPFAVQLVYEFTLLFSSIEPQVINYLTLNATKYNIDADAIDLHRQNGVTSSPLFEAIDLLIKKSDNSLIEQHVNSAIKATKRSVGLPSKIAAAGVFNLLATRYSISLTPFCGKLLKTCINSFQDRNDSVKLAFAKSLGFIFRMATIEKAGKYANLLCEMYFETSEIGSKKIIAAAIEAILKQAPSQFNNVSSSFIPLLYVASNDVEKPVGTAFLGVWREASNSGSSSVRLYFEEIMELLQKNITSVNFSTRRTCSRTIVLLCENTGQSIKPKQIQKMFEITTASLGGRSWEGKDVLLAALQSLVAKFSGYVSENTSLKESISQIFITEVSRSNIVYVKSALIPFCRYVALYPEDHLIQKLIQTLETTLKDEESSADAMTCESSNSTKRIKHDSDINKKSSRKNIEQEEYITNILKLCSEVTKSIDGGENNSILLFRFIIHNFSKLFENYSVHYTWRSQIAACEAGNILLDSHITSSALKDFQSLMEEFWHIVFKCNSSKESIENVRIQTIRLGAKMILNVPELRNRVETDLRVLSESELTSKVESELKNIDII